MDNKTFKYGTLVISCDQCGNETILEDLVEDGRAIYLFNTIGNSLKLHCPICDITMEMSIKPSKNIPTYDREDKLTPEELGEGVTEEYIPYEEFPQESTTKETV